MYLHIFMVPLYVGRYVCDMYTCMFIYVTGPVKINHVSANYTELYFRQYLQL